jgi:DNA-binding MarR family transcriptional regulator
MSRPPCVCTTLRKATRAVTRFYDEAIERTGISTAQLAVLRQIERAGAVPMSRIAEALVMDRTSLYRAVAPLVRDGLVIHADAAADTRARSLALTASGRARMARAGSAWDTAQARLVAHVGAERWQRLSASLLALAEDVGTWSLEEAA